MNGSSNSNQSLIIKGKTNNERRGIIKKPKLKIQLTDVFLIHVLNKFVFYLFLIFIIILNLLLLYIFPYHLKKNLVIND